MPKMRPVFLHYCARQQSASKRLRELLADPAHASHLEDCWSHIKDRTHGWNLDSMLIKPVQRITKYPLLFDDLLACTTPVHPDYFNIRAAAELARAVATEIDEAKRRKDVVASALSPHKQSKGAAVKDVKKGIKLFSRSKSSPMISKSASVPTNLSTESPPIIIRKSSFALLKTLSAKVAESEQVAKQVGKEILLWTAAREVLVAEIQLLQAWANTYECNGVPQSPSKRVVVHKQLVEDLISTAWSEMVSRPNILGLTPQDTQIRYDVMPMFVKLLDASINPRKVLVKHDGKASDYARYADLVKLRKHTDKALLESARDFCALHTQLVDELPMFLHSYSRILDIGVLAFARAQAMYYQKVRDALARFTREWGISGVGSDPAYHHTDIIEAWRRSWHPSADTIDNFRCIQRGELLLSEPRSSADSRSQNVVPCCQSQRGSQTRAFIPLPHIWVPQALSFSVFASVVCELCTHARIFSHPVEHCAERYGDSKRRERGRQITWQRVAVQHIAGWGICTEVRSALAKGRPIFTGTCV